MRITPIIILLYLFLGSFTTNGQNKMRDSLEQLSFDALQKASYENEFNFELGNLIADVMIDKAKREKHENNLAKAYYSKAIVHACTGSQEEGKVGLVYCDSIIELTKNKGFKDFPEYAYLMKGFIYDIDDDVVNRLSAYLEGYQYALRSNNVIVKNQALEQIADIKIVLGDFREAIRIYKELELYYGDAKYIKTNGKERLMLAFDGLSSSYLEAGIPDSALIYNKLGIKESQNVNYLKADYYKFLLNASEALYDLKEYNKALDSLNKFDKSLKSETQRLPGLFDKTAQIMYGYYLKGRIFESKKMLDSTIIYYKKVDSSFQKKQKLYSYFGKVYKTLFNYYSKHGTPTERLESVKKLIRVDSLLHDKHMNYNKQLMEGYERPKLEFEKQQLIKTIARQKKRTQFYSMAFILGLVVLAGVALFVYKRQQGYKSRYKTLINQTHQVTTTSQIVPPSETLDVAPELAEDILSKLEQFEAQQGFLDNDLSLLSLAKFLETNASYLSKILKHYKGNSYTNYIKELRINYAITELKTNKKLRSYTIKAIAELVGFNNAESFSKAFYKKAGIYPSFYIKQLNKTGANKVILA